MCWEEEPIGFGVVGWRLRGAKDDSRILGPSNRVTGGTGLLRWGKAV